jgi:hypothetical protein
LRVLVVNEPELAKAIGRLRGEWTERSGGELAAESTSWPELAKAGKADADVLIFPSRYLGELCARGQLRPVRESLLAGDSYDAADLLPAVQRTLGKWGGAVMAVPMGVALPTAGDVAEHPGLALLAAAAPAAMSDDRIGVLFDAETMKPRIAEAAFVDALTQMAAGKPESASAVLPTIAVLGFDDRLAAVSASSRNAASAFKLLEWLASADISAQLASSNKRLSPVRQSLASSSKWFGSEMSAGDRQDRGTKLKELLEQPRDFVVPRIPGIDEYMAALDAAVNSVIDDKATPNEALAKAAAAWEAITEKRGRDAQREAYAKHLNLDEG